MTAQEPEQKPLRLPQPLDLPAHWWGPFGRHPRPLTIRDLIANRTVDADLAAWLWLLIEAGASTLVCAGPSGAGKTTLLTALTAFLSPARAPYVVRGAYDPLDPITGLPPAETVLLVNEISGHLPIYLWGAGARRVFDAAGSGAQILATAHATTVEGSIRELTGPPVHASENDLRRWDLVLFLDASWRGERIERQVADAVSLSLDVRLISHTAGGLRPDSVPMQRLARRLGLSGGTIEQEVERRSTALGLAP